MVVEIVLHAQDCFSQLRQIQDALLLVVFAGQGFCQSLTVPPELVNHSLLHGSLRLKVYPLLHIRVDFVWAYQFVKKVDYLLLGTTLLLVKSHLCSTILSLNQEPRQEQGLLGFGALLFKFKLQLSN